MPARQACSQTLWSALSKQLLLLFVLLAVEWTQSTKDAIDTMWTSPSTKPRLFGHWVTRPGRGGSTGGGGRGSKRLSRKGSRNKGRCELSEGQEEKEVKIRRKFKAESADHESVSDTDL